MDSNLREASFLTLLNQLTPDIANQIKYLSGSLHLHTLSPVKTPEWTDPLCMVSGRHAVVRYIISERVGLDIYAYLGKHPVGFFEAIELGLQVFSLIEQLHSHNIVHGDWHSGNVAFRLNAQNELVLIDFGRAAIRPEIDDSDPNDPDIYCQSQSSPWESRGLKLTLRDDAFLAALLVGLPIHGLRDGRAQEHMCDERTKDGSFAQYMDLKQLSSTLLSTFRGSNSRTILPWRKHSPEMFGSTPQT